MKNYSFLLFLLLFCFPLIGKSQNASEKTDELSIQIEKKDATDANSDAFIKIIISGGVAPYRINCFSPYAAPSEIIGNYLELNNIKSGDYLFIIRDDSGRIVAKKEVSIINQR